MSCTNPVYWAPGVLAPVHSVHRATMPQAQACAPASRAKTTLDNGRSSDADGQRVVPHVTAPSPSIRHSWSGPQGGMPPPHSPLSMSQTDAPVQGVSSAMHCESAVQPAVGAISNHCKPKYIASPTIAYGCYGAVWKGMRTIVNWHAAVMSRDNSDTVALTEVATSPHNCLNARHSEGSKVHKWAMSGF